MWLVTVNQTYYTIRGHNKRRGRNKIKLICIVRPGQAGPDTHTDSKSKLGPLSFTASLNRNEYIKVNVISTIYGLWFYGDWVWHGHYHYIPPSLVRLHCGSVTGHTVEEGLNFYNVMNILLSLDRGYLAFSAFLGKGLLISFRLADNGTVQWTVFRLL